MSKILCDILGCDFVAFGDDRCVNCGIHITESLRRHYYRLVLRGLLVAVLVGLLWLLR